jgi:hypothetical protein
MSLSLRIQEFSSGRRQPKNAGLVRVVPARAFILPVAWEETSTHPCPVPLLIHPASVAPVRRAKTITRRSRPMELRWDPTL